MNGIKNPALKYNGSKFLLAPWIVSFFPEHTTYVSCFGGGASDILRKKKSKYEFYNDINEEVYNFFFQLRENGNVLIGKIENTPYHRRELELCFEHTEDSIERARRFYVRCWLSRGQNKAGKNSFRVVVNNDTGGHIPANTFNRVESLYAIRDRLKEIHFEKLDYREILKIYDNCETLFYLDPPYLGSTRGNKKYYDNEMLAEEEHEIICRSILNLKGMVIISGYDSDLYNSILDGWEKKSIETKDQARNEKIETLWLSPKVSERLEQRLFK